MNIEAKGKSVRFAVHVQPRASRTEIAGMHGEAVKIRLHAPPVDGEANDSLVKFLSELFAVSRRDVRILSGAQSRAKVVEIDGLSADAVRQILTLKR
jgi:uncharacterized protein (TIGR00251 family)